MTVTIVGSDDAPRIPTFTENNIAGDAYNRSVTVGDFNGDGKLDFITASPWYGNSSAYLYLGNGDGSFTKAASPILSQSGLVTIQSADLNGDGKLDLVTFNSGANTLSVALGDGTGHFGAASTYAAPGGAGFGSFADVDHDGHLDMLTSSGSQLLLYKGDARGRSRAQPRCFKHRVS